MANAAASIDVRIVKFTLPSGEIETLITNLFGLPEEKFKEHYFKRWPVAVKYDIVKNKLELPNFGGVTENIIMQDFWISMYLLNMAAIAKHEADEKIAAEHKDKQNKYEYQANVNTVIGSLRNRPAEAFCSDLNSRNRLLNRVFFEIQHSVVPKPLGYSSVPRYANPRKSKFHHILPSQSLWLCEGSMNGDPDGIAAARQFIAEHCKIKDFAMELSITKSLIFDFGLSCG